jgi:O-succinylbenzoic acid--CoA ligase
LFVPKTAVRERGQLTFVFIAQDGRARMRLVKTGKPTGDKLELLAGVEAGEMLIVSAAGELTDGRLIVHGRRGDLIISGGENIWPAPVEESLSGLGSIAEVAVVGRSDDEWGHVVTAIVVATDSSQPPTLDELRDHVKQTLPAYCAPRRIELLDALPRTPLGKIERRLL